MGIPKLKVPNNSANFVVIWLLWFTVILCMLYRYNDCLELKEIVREL